MTATLIRSPRADSLGRKLTQQLAQLEDAFGVEFLLIEHESGRRLDPTAADPSRQAADYAELAELLPRPGAASIIVEEPPLLLLAIALPPHEGREISAVGMFTTVRRPEISAPRIARLLHCSDDEINARLADQPIWKKSTLWQTAKVVCQNLQLQARVMELEFEVEKVSEHLSGTYEEISLLYGITQNLRLSCGEAELGGLALDWLRECVPARGLAAIYLPVHDGERSTYQARREAEILTCGDCPLALADFMAIIDHLELGADSQPFVGNYLDRLPNWKFDEVREIILTPMSEGKNLFGWLMAINHDGGGEFGTVEANLLNSVAAIIGIHGGNIDLYRQHREFLASVVRALTSAIDAKDPYTCGHSDRVARVSVRLAQQLGCDSGLLNTIYMAGLVHDIGKIGIDDQVLRKPGRLTNAEFEQIKLHPELGYKILADIKQFHDVLPVVLHHHEQWDGGGYPHGLAGEEIPWLARICAVADAYDAMSSDRPYRDGMPDAKVDAIFRSGSGKQWDERVVEAYFAARDDIREISRRERADLTLDVNQWAQLPPSPLGDESC